MGARLVDVVVPDNPEAAVLVLHGGGTRGANVPVSPTQLSVLRMIPIARRLKKIGRQRLAVFRLLNSARGWDAAGTPLIDVRWALAQLRSRLGELPIGLVGHSLGGRAALLSAGAPDVRSAVALAPWVQVGDTADLTDRRVLIVHGTADRVADLRKAQVVARSLAATADVGFVTVEGGSHSMLRHHKVFDVAAAQFMAATLLGDEPVAGGPVRQILQGERFVEV